MYAAVGTTTAKTLEIQYKGKTIRDVLAMTIKYAAEFFAVVPVVKTPDHAQRRLRASTKPFR